MAYLNICPLELIQLKNFSIKLQNVILNWISVIIAIYRLAQLSVFGRNSMRCRPSCYTGAESEYWTIGRAEPRNDMSLLAKDKSAMS